MKRKVEAADEDEEAYWGKRAAGPASRVGSAADTAAKTHHPPKVRWLNQAFIETDSGSSSSGDQDAIHNRADASRGETSSARDQGGSLAAVSRYLPAAATTTRQRHSPPHSSQHPRAPRQQQVPEPYQSLPLFQSYLSDLRSGMAPGKPRFAGVTTRGEYLALVRVRREQDIFKMRKASVMIYRPSQSYHRHTTIIAVK
jgi:hypothetical protein